MGIRTAWQAIAQPPGRFLASSWPWRSLAYLLCGIAPSAAVAAGVIALFSRPVSRAAPVVLPLAALALLGSGPVVAGTSAGACGSSTPASTPTGGGPRGPGTGPWRPATASSAWSCCG